MFRRERIALFLLAILAAAAQAQWSMDPAVNLAIADAASEQVTPKVARTDDGGTYVAWFDLQTGSYQVRLQRLDFQGYEMWPHGGIVVSAHPQSTSLVDWDLVADTSGNAVVVFTDTRDGDDLDVFAYRIGSDGSFLWGPDGVTLSSNDDYEAQPVATEASDGDFVFVWPKMPNTGGGAIMMQRLSPAGELRFAAGGIPVIAPGTEKPGFPQIVAALDGEVIVSYVRNIASFTSPRHVRVAKISTAGAIVWGPVAVYDQASVPIAHLPRLVADGQGGAISSWHSSVSNLFNCRVQHLSAAGVELFAHNGVTVSTSTAMHHLDPYPAYDPLSGEIFVVWNERNLNQSAWGVYAQKFAPDGTRAWGTEGLMLEPVDATYRLFMRCAAWDGTLMAFWVEEIAYGNDHILGMRLDAMGNQMWPDVPLAISSAPGDKSRLPIAAAGDGSVVLIWEDTRGGTPDVYGQNVNLDGSLGPGSVPIEDDDQPTGPKVPASFVVFDNYPNPFNPATTIRFDLPRAGQASLRVYDSAGRLVRTLVDGSLEAAQHSVVWDGTDDAGNRQPSGVYLYQLVTEERVESRKMNLVK